MSIEKKLKVTSESKLPEHKRNHNNHKKNKKKSDYGRYSSVFIMFAMTFFLICVSNSYAKYIKRISVKAPIEWMLANFHIEVLCDDGEEMLSKKLNLQDLNPGEFQSIPFVVRNAKKEGNEYRISDVDILYSIDVIYTENLPLTYTLYEYVGVDADGKEKYEELTYRLDDKNENNNFSNVGKKQIYSNDLENKTIELESKSGFNEITDDKYMLVIEWKVEDGDDEISDNDNKYIKEVDMVYLVVRASQKE